MRRLEQVSVAMSQYCRPSSSMEGSTVASWRGELFSKPSAQVSKSQPSHRFAWMKRKRTSVPTTTTGGVRGVRALGGTCYKHLCALGSSYKHLLLDANSAR